MKDISLTAAVVALRQPPSRLLKGNGPRRDPNPPREGGPAPDLCPGFESPWLGALRWRPSSASLSVACTV
jgi:hypothetical protein